MNELDKQIKLKIESIKNSISNGDLRFSKEFLNKVQEIKLSLEKDLDKTITPVITIDDYKKLSKEERKRNIKRIRVKT